MGEATGKTADDLKKKLSEHIDAAKTKLDALKKDLNGMHQEDMQALQERCDQVRQRLDQQKERTRKMQEDIVNWKNEKVAHTQDAIGSWRQKREIKKLEARAERAEDNAVDMVTVAAFDFDEAEQAVLDAIVARYEAQQAAGSAA
jgi:DNA repair exonuclease SbcCD ATPase subunit